MAFAVTTKSLADGLGIKAASIRSALSRRGEFLGIKPIRLRNGRLLWPRDQVDSALGGCTVIDPWPDRLPCTPGEALSFVRALATAAENNRYALISHAGKDAQVDVEISMEVQNLAEEVRFLTRAYPVREVSHAE